MQPAQLGPYEIVRPLGKGGMGTVYEGRDKNLGLRVAVKVLKPELAATEGFRERFEAEIESLKKLRHAAIVRLYGYGEQDGCLYYSMELAAGSTLEHQLRSGCRFDWREVTRIGIQLAKALKHAHDHGVIHRDIKPANLLVSATGEIKLSDFGIARIFGGNQLTSAGGILGTAEYMAPEQAAGERIDSRCDQYSLGCVLYALLAGRPPFRASGMAELLQLQRFAEPEPVRSFARSTPTELERIIMQLLEKDPARRFRNTLVLAHRLEAMDRALTQAGGGKPAGAAAADAEGGQAAASDLPETLAASLADAASEAAAVGPAVDDQTAASASPAGQVMPPLERPNQASHFLTLEEAERLERDQGRESRTQAIFQGLVLLAALGVLVGLVAYFARSRSADALFEDIAAAGAKGSGEALLGVKEAIGEFMRRFPDDPRAPKVAVYQEELRLFRADRRFEGQARRGQGIHALTPAEQMYVAALRQADRDPEQAAAQLQALLDLYAGNIPNPKPAKGNREEAANGPKDRRLLTLAKRRHERLERQIRRAAQAHRRVIEARLRDAQRLQANDPERARRIWRGVVQLYGKKPWAADLVGQARSQLATVAPATGN